MNIKFWKMSGSGNDFIFIDNRKNQMNSFDLPNFIQKVCARGVSVGADGLVLIENSDVVDFKWKFFNSDATEAEMCGNASRCAAKFAFLNGIVDSEKMKFETLAGIIEAEIIDNDTVKVLLTKPFNLKANYNIEINGKNYIISSVDTGVPHVVTQVKNIENFDLYSFGKAVRYHEEFAPQGTNVNIYEKVNDKIRMRTYERGVENETMACGTGAVATAIFAVKDDIVKSPVTIVTSSKIELKVYLEEEKCYLEGEARVIYKGELQEDAYKY